MKLRKLKSEIVRQVTRDGLIVAAGVSLGVMLVANAIPEIRESEYKQGYDAGYKKASDSWKSQYFRSPKNAVFITYDNSGAWLGSTPGAKEAPLYNHLGQQVGRWKDEINDPVTSPQ